MPLADLSLWNWAPNDNGMGPGVANLQGTEAYFRGTDALSAGFGDVKAGGEATQSQPRCGPFDFWRKITGQCTDAPPKMGDGGSSTSGCATWDIGCRVQSTVGDVLTNKSLWLLAGMILLFVVLVAVLRTR